MVTRESFTLRGDFHRKPRGSQSRSRRHHHQSTHSSIVSLTRVLWRVIFLDTWNSSRRKILASRISHEFSAEFRIDSKEVEVFEMPPKRSRFPECSTTARHGATRAYLWRRRPTRSVEATACFPVSVLPESTRSRNDESILRVHGPHSPKPRQVPLLNQNMSSTPNKGVGCVVANNGRRDNSHSSSMPHLLKLRDNAVAAAAITAPLYPPWDLSVHYATPPWTTTKHMGIIVALSFF